MTVVLFLNIEEVEKQFIDSLNSNKTLLESFRMLINVIYLSPKS